MRLLRLTDDKPPANHAIRSELYLGWVRGRLGKASRNKDKSTVAFFTSV